MSGRVQRLYDNALSLRASGTPITSTTSETGIAFPVRDIGDYKAVVAYNGKAFATNETYVVTIEVSDLVGGTYTAIASIPDIGSNGVAAGFLDIPLSGKIAEQLDVDSAFIRVTTTIAGTAPSIDYDCFLTRD